MARKVTLFTGQWVDLPLEELAAKAAAWGYDGLELSCRGDHFDVDKAVSDPAYCDALKQKLTRHGLGVWAISNHLTGQLICDPNDARSDSFAPTELAGDPEGQRLWAIEHQKNTARAAQKMGISVTPGFTGSPIWQWIYSFPPVSKEMIRDGYRRFAELFHPILDVYASCGVKFALEVHPTEIAFDIVTAKRALEAVDYRPEFGFNFDPSHLFWQRVDPVKFIETFPDRIFHVHIKDAALQLDGISGILGSHLDFDEPGRGWNFRSPGHGQVNFEEIIRALNRVGYDGPLSVEWEDCGMDREFGAEDACRFTRSIDFKPSRIQFDAAFSTKAGE